jgi:hypothetical protein
MTRNSTTTAYIKRLIGGSIAETTCNCEGVVFFLKKPQRSCWKK